MQKNAVLVIQLAVRVFFETLLRLIKTADLSVAELALQQFRDGRIGGGVWRPQCFEFTRLTQCNPEL